MIGVGIKRKKNGYFVFLPPKKIYRQAPLPRRHLKRYSQSAEPSGGRMLDGSGEVPCGRERKVAVLVIFREEGDPESYWPNMTRRWLMRSRWLRAAPKLTSM
jgi:hypothetical protein